MVPDGPVEVSCGGVGYEIERELGEFVDRIGFQMDKQYDISLGGGRGKAYRVSGRPPPVIPSSHLLWSQVKMPA